ncbi:MAG: cytochrome c3 family protein [Pseudomonadota bacterium]
MEKKRQVTLMILLVGVLMFGADAPAADESPPGELDTITFNTGAFDKDRKGPVGFAHKKHARDYGVNCWECHHDYDNDKTNTWSPWDKTEKCVSCHDPAKKQKNAAALQAAFHLQCENCHRERDVFKGEFGAYKNCGKCHLEAVLIPNEGKRKDKIGPVMFQHRTHEKKYFNADGKRIACAECHHDYRDGENMWKDGDPVRKCGSCHDAMKKKAEKQYRLRVAYHKNCRDCHKALIKAGKSKKAPYKECSGCHRKPD